MPEFINSPSNVIYNRIKITICDPKNGYIEGIDMYNQSIRLAYSFYHSPYVQVPRINESWIVKKIDNNWNLYARFESEDQINNIADLSPGDVRIESKNILYIDADQEILIDFNKAAPSLKNLEENTLPGTALFGSGTLDKIQAGTGIFGTASIGTVTIGSAFIGTSTIGMAFIGTASIGTASIGTATINDINIVNKITTPLVTALPTEDVLDGQEERYQNNSANGIVWNFRYDDDVETTYKWHFIGGPPHISFITASTATTGTAWFNYGGSPSLTIPYTGEYVLSGGAECIASANNMGFNLGLSINGSVPTSTLTAYASARNTAISVNTTYYVILNAGDVLTEVYRKDPDHNPGGTATFLNRWMSVTPIRVTT